MNNNRNGLLLILRGYVIANSTKKYPKT